MRVLDPIILSLAAVAAALPTSGLPTDTNAANDAPQGSATTVKRPNPVDLGVVDGGRVDYPPQHTVPDDAMSGRDMVPKGILREKRLGSECKTAAMKEKLEKDENDRNTGDGQVQ